MLPVRQAQYALRVLRLTSLTLKVTVYSVEMAQLMLAKSVTIAIMKMATDVAHSANMKVKRQLAVNQSLFVLLKPNSKFKISLFWSSQTQ